jgi:hypothetical protein
MLKGQALLFKLWFVAMPNACWYDCCGKMVWDGFDKKKVV